VDYQFNDLSHKETSAYNAVALQRTPNFWTLRQLYATAPKSKNVCV